MKKNRLGNQKQMLRPQKGLHQFLKEITQNARVDMGIYERLVRTTLFRKNV